MATPEDETTPRFQSSTRKLSYGTLPKESHQKELVKATLQRDEYKRYCKEKDQLIQEYHDALADKETELMYQSSVIKELEEQLTTYHVSHLKEKEDKAKTQCEESLASKDRCIKELGDELEEAKDLKELLSEKEGEIIRLTEENNKATQIAAEEKKQTIRQLRGELDELVKKNKTQERHMKDLVEKIQLKELELAVCKEDFESERNDRQRIHAEYEELKTKTEEARIVHQANKDAMARLAEEKQNYEEEIQVLTAQVNAYSREVDKQKGLVTQSQEKHKTEVVELKSQINELQSSQQQVSELKESLANERKSKQQLAGELASMRQQLDHVTRTNQQLDNELVRMRQQLDNVSASKEELLRAYHEERAMVTRLEDQVQKIKQANKVLVDKLKSNNASSASASSNQAHISSRRNDVPSGNYYQISAQASSGPSVEGEEGDEMHDSNRAYSDLIHEKPQLTAEEMAALFKKPTYYEMESGYDEQEAEKLQRLPKASDKDNDDETGRPYDPNLVCPKCGKQYRVGEIQKLRRHINERCNEQCSNEDSDESDEEIDHDQKEIEEMAEQRRKEMQGPTTAEVLFDDGDSSLPYDPNLVCPKCGKQYRVGEIQKLRRHINEFCTGMR